MHFAVMVIIMMAVIIMMRIAAERVHWNIVAHCTIPIR